MGLVDDDGEFPVQVLLSHGLGNNWELLDGGDDDPLALGDEPLEVGGSIGVPHGGVHLSELLYRLADLVVQHHPVGDDYGGVEDGLPALLEPDELAGQPGDGIGLAAARGVLDEVALAGAVVGDVAQDLAHGFQLVVPGPDLLLPNLLGVVLNDVREAPRCQGLLPEVVGPESLRVGRVASAPVVALVEGQEDRLQAGEFGTEPDPVLVDGHVGGAAPCPEQVLPGVAGRSVLLNRILHRLLGEAVLELEGQNGEPVDEQKPGPGRGPCSSGCSGPAGSRRSGFWR